MFYRFQYIEYEFVNIFPKSSQKNQIKKKMQIFLHL